MRLTVQPSELAGALEIAARATAKSSGLPVLGMVLVEALPDGGCCVTGTDLRTRAWATSEATVDEAGAVCLPPERLRAFLDAVDPDEPISLVVAGGYKATLTSGRTVSRMAGIDPEQFTPAPDFEAPAFDYTLAADVLVGLISKTAHAAAKDDSRPTMAGLSLAFNASTLTVAAADGYRLARAMVEVDGDDVSLIVPARPLVEVARALKGASTARMVVSANGDALLVDSEVGCWAIRLIEGAFPDFARIIPRDPPNAVKTSRGAILRALRLVRGLEATSDGFKVHLRIEARSIEVRASDRQLDHEATAVIDAELLRGEPIEISFNTAYLTEAIEATDGDGVLLEIRSPASPVAIRSTRDDAHLQVVMPMHDPGRS